MEPVLMFTDTAQYNERIKEHSTHLGQLNAILAAYTIMNLPALTGAEFINMISHPGVVVFDKMTDGKPVNIMGMQVNKAKAMELIVKPEGYDFMNELIETYKKVPNWAQHLHKTNIENGEVVLHKSVIEREKKDSEVFATTDHEKKLFEFAQTVTEAANSAFGNTISNLPQLIETIIHTRATPSGTLLDPLYHFTHEIKHRKIKGFMQVGWEKKLEPHR